MGIAFNKKLILILWAASCVVFCSAQDKKSSAQNRPDLTGTWERNPSKSRNGQRPMAPSVVTLIISHREPELKITRKDNFKGKETTTDSVYYTDGRGEKNASRFSSVVSTVPSVPREAPDQSRSKHPDVTSKTKWEGNKLMSRSSTHIEVMGNRVDIDVTERREVSADGKTLTIVTSVMPGRSTITEIFDRVQ